MDLSLSSILLVLLIFQGLSLSIFLYTTGRGKSEVNIILGLLLTTLSIHMFLNLLETGFSFAIIKLNNILGFLYGPLIWIYVDNIINLDRLSTQRHWFLFLPFIISLVVQYTFNYSFFGPIILGQTLIYLFLSFRSLRQYERIIKQTKSHSNWISLTWLNQFLGGVVLLFLFDLLRNMIHHFKSANTHDTLFNVLLLLIILMINIVVFKSLNHTSKFMGVTEEDRKLSIDQNQKLKKLELTEDEVQHLRTKIEGILLKKKLFMQAELTLTEFADYVEELPRTVSQIINLQLKTNFSDWINEHRIQYAKKLLETTTSKEKNISQILYESGFNSKSSFYNTFSKKVGLTPKEYRKSIQGN